MWEFQPVKIALAQINPVVGDIAGNSAKIVDVISRARTLGASLVVFPELALAGYPPRDLLLKPRFVRANIEAVHRVAESCVGIAALVGFVDRNTEKTGRPLRNAAAYCCNGGVRQICYKSLLPTYDVFDECRYFEPGPQVTLVDHLGTRLGVSICEDLWNDEQIVGRRIYAGDPVGQLAGAGARLLINMSASPFEKGKHTFRSRLFGHQARTHRLPILFVNQVGGNDELIFDGASMMLDAEGRIKAQAKPFQEDLLVVEPHGAEPGRMEAYPEDIAAV